MDNNYSGNFIKKTLYIDDNIFDEDHVKYYIKNKLEYHNINKNK
jgi:hypothetical protein